MKTYSVKGYATITFEGGEVASSNLSLIVATNDIQKELKRIESGAPKGVKVNNYMRYELVGERYFVKSNEETSFMGVKFPKNSIKEIDQFSEGSLSIRFTDKHGKADYASIGYGHLLRTDQKVVLDKFFADLTYSK